MPALPEIDRDQAFLEEILKRGLATEAQVEEARRLKAAADELGQTVTVDEILVRRGILAQDRAAEVRREVATRLGQSLRVGKYDILQRLGEGGSGVVYRAFQTTLGREVALKLLTRKREGEEEYIDRFMREARVAVTLNHVNIVRGLDYGNADGYHYFAMELVEGESLRALLKREGRLTEKKALDFGLQMVRALEHAGKFQIVHRDIKPENILITRSGTAKLCDLGLARPVIGGEAADSEGRPIGTALYVAPEQIRHEPKLDFRADVYSLGATLYHTLTGSPPFTGATVPEIVRAHLSAPVPNPREKVLEVSTGAASIVMKMMSKDPADRYQTLESLDEDLDSVLAGRPPVNTITIGRRAAPLSGEGPARTAEAGRRARSSAVPAAVAALVLGAVGAWYALRGNRGEPPPAPPPSSTGVKPDVEAATDAARIRDAREAAGAAALVGAESFAKEHGDAAESAAQYRAVADAHADTSAGRIAGQRASGIEKAVAERIQAALRSRTEDFDGAFAAGRFGQALEAWAKLPPEVEAAGGRAAAEAARVRVEEASRRSLEAAGVLAGKALAGDAASLEPARKALRAAASCGIAAVEKEAARRLQELDATVRDRGDRQRAAEEAWPRVCAEAVAAASRGQKEGAAVLDANAALLAPVAERVGDLRALLEDVGGFSEAVRSGFARAAAAGESVRLHVPGRPGGAVSGRAAALRPGAFEIQRGPAAEVVAEAEVDPEDLAAFAWKVLGIGSVRDHRAAAAFFLSRGAFGPAATEVKTLQVMGAAADAERARTLLETVRRAASGRAEAALREAEVLHVQKRLPEAKAAFERAASLCDGYAPALWKQGAFLLETSRDPAEALRPLEAAAALDPPEPEAWYWIGEGRRRAGKLEEALAAFDRFLAGAAAGDPRREAARAALEGLRTAAVAASLKQAREDASRAYRKDEFAAAEELWRKVLKYAPDDVEACYYLAKSLLALDRKVEGYGWLRRFLAAERRSGPRLDDARKVVRDMEQRLGDSPAATRKATEGSTLLAQGQIPQAVEALSAAIDLAPLRADSYMERGRALQYAWVADGRKDHLIQSVQDLEMAVLMNEKNGRAWSLLAATRFYLEDWERSADAAAKGVALDPYYVAGWEFRARACCKVGRFADAEQAATEGFAKEPRAMLLIARAEARCGLRKLAEARADLDRVGGDPHFRLTDTEKAYRAEVLERVLRAERAGQ